MTYKKPTVKVTSTPKAGGTTRTCGVNTFHCNKFDCGNVYICGVKF